MGPGPQSIIMDIHLPAGVAGPAPLDFDVRCYLVPHPDGLLLVDTGVVGSHVLMDPVLERLDAGWGDITDVVLTHNHPDHVGGLAEVVARARDCTVWAGAGDHPGI